MKVNHELNNMTWRVKPDEVLIEVGKLFGSKVGLQKLNFEVNFVEIIIVVPKHSVYLCSLNSIL